MACKIAETSESIQQVMWPLASPIRLPAVSQPAATPAQKPNQEEVFDAQKLRELERLRQAELAQCRESAFAEGLKKGREDAAIEIKGATDRLAQTLRDIAAVKRRARSEAETDVVKLSLAIAKRVLHRELSLDPESIQGVVHAALQKLANREITSVRVCPSCADSVRQALERADGLTAISIVPDGRMGIGDIVFETTLGELDASINTQLKEIERGFVDRLGLQC